MLEDQMRGKVSYDDLNRAKEKYRVERDRRVEAGGGRGFTPTDGKFQHFTADPFAPELQTREPIEEELDVLIVGAGHSGMMAAVEMRRRGKESFRIIDGAADFGGTWYWNRYPGLRCDVESYIYMPLLEETGVMPSEKYARGREIFHNARMLAEHFSLYERAIFQTHVEELRWHEDRKRWRVTTNRGDVLWASNVILALGPLNKPKLPGLKGLDSYKGHMFHTSRWDYTYTGGDWNSDEPVLDGLRGKRVGIVGTGCTGIQCAPRVAEYADKVYIFQRTPSGVNFRVNSATDPEWFASQEKGWQRARSDNFNMCVQGFPVEEDLVNDGWTKMNELMRSVYGQGLEEGQTGQDPELIDFAIMEAIRERVEKEVYSPETAEKLKAWYRVFCKRPTFSDQYLTMFNRPNVELVDTDGKGVTELTEAGAKVGDDEYAVDCIVFASGFEVGTDYCKRGNLAVYGRNGQSLSDKWSMGVRTLYGFLSADFPNLFHMGLFLQNSAFGNFTTVFESQARRINEIMDHVAAKGASTIEATPEAEAEWAEVIKSGSVSNRDFLESCTPGYFNGEGKPESGSGLSQNQFPGGMFQFDEIVDTWFEKGLPGTVTA